MSTEEELSRYLIVEEEYRKVVGKLLVHRIAQVFKELGFKTKVFRVNANGVDIQIYSNSELVIVVEVLNWCCRSNLPKERKDRIVKNLLRFDCHRVLIHTPFENTYVLSDLLERDISLIELNYQILPGFFYNQFAKSNKEHLRKADSKETSLHIKAKLEEFLASIGLQASL